jgi:hypothetical protein
MAGGVPAFDPIAAAELTGRKSALFAPVTNVSSVRTVDGHFDDYMHWLATTWKQQDEATGGP